MRTYLAALSLACMLLAPTVATGFQVGEDEGARAAFERSHTKVLALVEADTKPKVLQREVDGLLDYDWIAKSALGGPSHYAQRCAERCAEFEARLSELIRANYLRRLTMHEGVRVEYLGEQVRETATKVGTRIRFTDGAGQVKALEVDYVMHRDEGRWVVRDIVTEGVSLARTYRYEINKLYTHGGIDEVIATLEYKLDELGGTSGNETQVKPS